MRGLVEQPPDGAAVKPLVLIADGNAERGRRLAEACERAGLAFTTGSHGAAALETALRERPGVVVAQVDLPLVDAPKLAEILRVNPRTRCSRFLFLGNSPPGLVGPGDRQLPAVAETSVIVEEIESLIGRQRRLDAIEEAALGVVPMRGALEFVGLAELLLLFQAHRVSGRLALERSLASRPAGPAGRGVLLLRDGSVLQAECDSSSCEKALFRMLGWRHGRFEFQPGATDEPASMSASTTRLVRAGLRQLEQWTRSVSSLPSLDARVKRGSGRGALPTLVDPLAREVLSALEVATTVREVVDHCAAPDYPALKALQKLVERQIVELVGPDEELPSAEASGSALLDADELGRLQERVGAEGSARESLPAAKLLVTAASPGALLDFVRVFGRLPGATLAPRVASGRVDFDRLEALGEIAFDGGLRIELIHLPRDGSFAPAWELAGYGGLATLFLLDGRVSQAAEALRPIFERVSSVPCARTFHVALLSKADPGSADSWSEELEEFDEASMFRLPLETGESAVSLLRGLFSRILR